jgi:hypothetical protein
MQKGKWLVAILMILIMVAPALAAPLFGDVPASHWAKDAIASLAAKGLLEGYPDGTFKGDRATTRYEMAMVIARLLAKVEQMGANYASKADMETIKGLVDGLREELDAMGVRVTSAEDNLQKLNTRVTALEKITFYGSIDAMMVSQGFSNTGHGDWDGNTNPRLSYANMVGAIPGSQLYCGNGMRIPASYPKFPVADYINGRILTSGTGYSTLGVLGLKIKVSEDIAAGAEFKAFISGGDAVVDMIWGISPPFLANQFAGLSQVASPQPLSNQPWTRMVLDNFWITHNPTGTKLIVGAYNFTNMDGIVFKGEENPNANGPRYIPYYGFDLTGKNTAFLPFKYELLWTKLGQGTNDITLPLDYYPWALGLNLGFEFYGVDLKLNFLRSVQDQLNGTPAVSGQYPNYNGWACPQDYLNKPASERPVVPLGIGGTGLGPQSVTTWGISLKYKFNLPVDLKFIGEYGNSTYKPNMASSYEKNGNSMRLGLASALMGGNLGLALDYVSTDPYYDPMDLHYPTYGTGIDTMYVPFWTLPTGFNVYPGYYQLHDSYLYPNNRQGIRFKVDYKFSGGNGKIGAKYTSLEQVNDCTFPITGGYNPGFIEPVFGALYQNADGTYPETPKGKVTNWGLNVEYNFFKSLKCKLGYEEYNFQRDSGSNNVFVISQNYFKLYYNAFRLGLSYPLTQKFSLLGGYDIANAKMSNYSLANTWDYRNYTDSTQGIPYLGFNFNISNNTAWNAMIKVYQANDNLGDNSAAGTLGTNPFNWNGTQLTTQFTVKF